MFSLIFKCYLESDYADTLKNIWMAQACMRKCEDDKRKYGDNMFFFAKYKITKSAKNSSHIGFSGHFEFCQPK